ncbi:MULTISPECIES: hypothetical protein [Oceanobacillus]|uniref:hypothetical protein n=1 Tax=Oceanobacillus TaxID=182709 RepID=UPI000595DA04|nr:MULTISPECIES: hypothetical protein [Oceanobacillus]
MFTKNKDTLWVCSRVVKSITCGMELFMCLPVIGWFVSSLTGVPVMMLFLMHSVSLFFAIGAGVQKLGNIIGLIASLASYFPVIGWLLHIIVSILLIRDIKKMKKKENLVEEVY